MGSLFALISVVCSSTHSAFGKILLEYLPPLSFLLMGQVISVLVLLMIFGLLTEAHKFFHLSKKDQGVIIVISFFTAVIAPLLFYTGLTQTSAINAVLLGRVQPLITGLISVYWLKEKSSPNQLLGALGIGFGSLFIITEGFSRGMTLGEGDSLILSAAACWAIGTNLFKKYGTHLPVELVVLSRNVVSSIIIIALIPFFVEAHTLSPNQVLDYNFYQMMAMFCIIMIILSQTFWYKALDMIPATQVSSIGLALPFFGVMWVILLLGEPILDFHVYGSIFIFIGLMLTLWHRQKNPNHELYQRAKRILKG